MRILGFVLLAAAAGFGLTAGATVSKAQVGVEIGVAPDCPYGYYPAPPYACAPYGYYGPEWFSGGVFLGAGPWFHGPHDFHGHVNNRFDPERGYKGPMPKRGEKANRRIDSSHFKGNEMRDAQGHVVKGKR